MVLLPRISKLKEWPRCPAWDTCKSDQFGAKTLSKSILTYGELNPFEETSVEIEFKCQYSRDNYHVIRHLQ